MIIDRPVFLLGVMSGGLTIISRILRRHPLMIGPASGPGELGMHDEMHYTARDLLPNELQGIWHPFLSDQTSGNANKRNFLYASKTLLPHFRKTKEDATPEMKKRFENILLNVVEKYNNWEGYARLVDKSQTHTVRVSLIHELLKEYDPKFILVTRNPYAWCSKFYYDNDQFHYGNKMEDVVDHWFNTYDLAIKDLHNNKISYIGYRLEDLLQNPFKYIKVTCDHINISCIPSMFDSRLRCEDNKWFPLQKEVNKKYIDLVQDDLKEAINAKCGNLMKEFQYDIL